jgi:hypothetical protein
MSGRQGDHGPRPAGTLPGRIAGSVSRQPDRAIGTDHPGSDSQRCG